MRIVVFLLLITVLAYSQQGTGTNSAKENVHDLELIEPRINFFEADGGYYEIVPFFYGDKYVFISTLITNNGDYVESNVILNVEFENLYDEQVTTYVSDTISFFAPGDTLCLHIDSILLGYYSVEIRLNLEFDSIDLDFEPNERDTATSFCSGHMWADYLRLSYSDTMISTKSFPADSDGKFLIGNEYFLPESFNVGEFYIFVSILPETCAGTTLIGKIFDENGEFVAETEEYDINSYDYLIDLSFWGDIYDSFEGGKLYKVVVEFYTGSDSIVFAANSENTFGNFEHTIFGQKEGDSIVWNTMQVIPLIGLRFYPEIIEEQKHRAEIYYPNPTNDFLELEIEMDEEIRILDLNGRVLFMKKLESGHQVLDVSFLPSGIYFLHTKSSGLKGKFVVAR